MLPEMPAAIARVAEYILKNPQAPLTLSIGDLADEAGTAAATVTRFSRGLGFKGYASLRVAIATETGRAKQARWETDISGDISPDDSLDSVLKVIATADTRAIQATAAGLDMGDVERVAAAIASASATTRAFTSGSMRGSNSTSTSESPEGCRRGRVSAAAVTARPRAACRGWPRAAG